MNPERIDQHYTFGDNDRAAARLELLAEVFEPTTRVFVVRALGFLERAPRRALDLGAGPGHTTRLLGEILPGVEFTGLDNSARYVELARARHAAFPRLRFERVDVQTETFAASSVDFVYCRHLLVHLPDPEGALRRAQAALTPQESTQKTSSTSLVALEETAGLRSPDPAFTLYYQTVERMQAHYGQRMFLGASLDEVARRAGLEVLDARIERTLVCPQKMARLHLDNLRTFRDDAFVKASVDVDVLARLERSLTEVATGTRAAPPVEVELGQVIAR